MNIIAILLGLAVLGAFYLLYQGHEKRISRLEDAQQKRINYSSLEEIENAMAELAVLEAETDMRKERIESVRKHLSKAHTPKEK